MKKTEKLTLGSLYAGVGGICLGFKNAGFDISWANEFDKNACVTYRQNFDHKLYEGDIMKMDISSTKRVDVLAGGFPCQPFSVAGYRKGRTRKDPRLIVHTLAPYYIHAMHDH